MSETQAPKPETLPYRPCVGVMLLNADGLVFTGRRIDTSVESWQMPQGGIDQGEAPQDAAFRELREEIGTDKAEILRDHADWLNYDLPEHLLGIALHGKYRGQTQKWFAMRFLGQDGDIDLTAYEPEFAEWRWLPTGTIMEMIVPFKRAVYERVFAEFADLL